MEHVAVTSIAVLERCCYVYHKCITKEILALNNKANIFMKRHVPNSLDRTCGPFLSRYACFKKTCL